MFFCRLIVLLFILGSWIIWRCCDFFILQPFFSVWFLSQRLSTLFLAVGVNSLTPKSKEKRSLHPFDQFGSKPRIRARLAPFLRAHAAVIYAGKLPRLHIWKNEICNPSSRFGSLADVCLHCFWRSFTSRCKLPPKMNIRAHLAPFSALATDSHIGYYAPPKWI